MNELAWRVSSTASVWHSRALYHAHQVIITMLAMMSWCASWWRHQTFSALLALCEGNPPVTGWFPSQRPVTWSIDVFFDLRQNKRLNKQSRRRWFETPWRSLWRHCSVIWTLVWHLSWLPWTSVSHYAIIHPLPGGSIQKQGGTANSLAVNCQCFKTEHVWTLG